VHWVQFLGAIYINNYQQYATKVNKKSAIVADFPLFINLFVIPLGSINIILNRRIRIMGAKLATKINCYAALIVAVIALFL